MDRLNIHAKFCCFRRETGLTFAAWLEAIVSVLFLILSITLACEHEIRGILAFLVIAISSLNVVMVIFLIFGLAMRNRFFIVPWLTMTTFQLFLIGLVLTPFLLPICLILAPIIFAVYRTICTFELFKDLQKDDDRIQSV